jgi:hypothetical protein
VGWTVGVAIATIVGVEETVGMGDSVAGGAAVAVAAGTIGAGVAVQVGAGTTVAAVLQADRTKAKSRVIPTNLINTFLVTIIHTRSLFKNIQCFFHRNIQQNRGQRIFPAFIEFSYVNDGFISSGFYSKSPG